MTPKDKHWHSDIEAPLKLATLTDVSWASETDVVVVGLGGAGVAAALQSIEKQGAVHQRKRKQVSKTHQRTCIII